MWTNQADCHKHLLEKNCFQVGSERSSFYIYIILLIDLFYLKNTCGKTKLIAELGPEML